VHSRAHAREGYERALAKVCGFECCNKYELIGASDRAHHTLTHFHELRLRLVSWRKAVLLYKLHLEVGRALRELRALHEALEVSLRPRLIKEGRLVCLHWTNEAASPNSQAPASVSNLVELSGCNYVEVDMYASQVLCLYSGQS
jgi:hypothetical protein